jgi:hypothetical protein
LKYNNKKDCHFILNLYNWGATIYLYHSTGVNSPTALFQCQQAAIVSLCIAVHHQPASSSCFSSAFPNLWSNLFSLVFCSIALSAGSFCQYQLLFVRMCDSNSLDSFGCSGAGFDCEAGLHWFETLLKSCTAASRSFEQLDWFACLSASATSNLSLLDLQ